MASICSQLFAAEKAFTLSGVSLTLEDVSSEVEVRYRSMRLNRALNVWNVEVTLTNKGSRFFRGPFVLLIDSFAGTTGPQQTEGVDDSTPPKPLYDLSNWVPGGMLAPGTNSQPRTLALGFTNGTPSLTTKVYARIASGYALGLTRSLNDVGQPLPGVQVVETGPQTVTTNQTDGAFGLVTLGQTNGQHVWKFNAPDHLPVWRTAALGGADVTVLPNPRLTRRSGNSVVLTPVQGGQVATEDGNVLITFLPGVLAQNSVAVLTPVTAQTLPALLPLGWSPLQAFWLELTQEPGSPITASLRPWGPLNPGDTVVLARWDSNAAQWITAQLLTGNGANAVATSLPGSGAFCLVAADSGAAAPPAPQAGQPLPPSTVALPQPGSLSAAGSVNPSSSPASRVAELVTATAQVTVTNQAGPLPSGLVLRCEIMENYRLRDGNRRLLPQYENFIIGYQRPGDNDLRTLQADFPLRPLLLLGSDELEAATVTVDVLSPTPFSGAILDATGGQAVLESIRLLAGTGDLAGRQAVQIRQQNPTNFSDLVFGGATIVQVFELGVGGVNSDRRLTAQFSGLPTNSLFVLARVVSHNGLYGLEPRERLATDSNGNLTTREPAGGERLPGVNSAGQYVLVRTGAPQGLVTGVARNSAGLPAPDLPVRIVGQPWLTFSETGGAFRLIAPVGSADVSVTDLTTGDTGQTAVVVADPQAIVNAAPSTAAVGPSVVSINPTNTATLVPRVTPIVIAFSEPINPGSLGASGIQLLGTNGQPVEASLTLNLRNTIATLLPTTQLAASTLHTVRLSTNIADFTGLKLEGANSFAFTTESDALDRIQTAQVVSYEPTNGVAVMTGSPGIAEPESPVILVNETTGRSATILSKPDGSFTNSIEAGVDDFLSAVIVNKNGTRNTMPVTRQIFRDGSVGLFNGGGILEAQGENGSVQVLIEPGSVPNKTVFKLETLSVTNVLAAVSNTPPEGGRLLGGFNFSVKGDRLKQPADVVFPVNTADLEIPPGGRPEDATFALAFPREADGVTTYEVIDRMVYQDGKLTTHSRPFVGLGTDIGGLFLPGFDDALFALLLTPIQLYVGSSAVVSGKVLSAFVNTNGATPPWIEGTERFLPGARVTVSPLGQAARPGRLRPGSVVATSGADGSFVMMLPAGAEVALRATHPRYPGLAAYKQSTLPGYEFNFLLALLGRVLSAYDLIFLFENPSSGPDTNTPPELFYSHTPLFPVPGSNATIRLLATDNASVPTISATVDAVQSSETNVNLTPADVTFQLSSEETVGAFGKRNIYSLLSTNAARVVLRVTAADASGNERLPEFHTIEFGGIAQSGDNAFPPSDVNDKVGPHVVASFPIEGEKNLDPGKPVVIRFDEPIDRAVLQDPSAIQISPSSARPSVQLSDDQQELKLFFFDLRPETDYTLTLTPEITDLSGNPLDQSPRVEGNNDFVLHFKTATVPTGVFTEIQSGGGAVIKGAFAYVLERTGTLDGGVLVYDVSNPTAPQKVAEFSVPGYPRDLALIPNYSFRRRPEAAAETKDLLAVVGGKLGHLQVGQYLWIIDIATPQAPQRVAAAAINLSPSTAVTKVLWSPPFLGYSEIGDFPAIGLINLQTFILGLHLTPEEFLQLPAEGTQGTDLNDDGDFVDSGEELPLPASRSRDVAGKVGSLILGDTDQFITDFDLKAGGGFVGVVVEQGRLLGANGLPTDTPVPAGYRTLVFGGLDLPRTNAFYAITNGRPSRVTTLFQYPVAISNQLSIVNLALISVNGEGGGTNRLVVLDVTDPTAPHLFTEIPIPTTEGESLFSVIEPDDPLRDIIPRLDRNSLLLATSRNVLVLDPAKFAIGEYTNTVVPHPALIGFVPSAGKGAQTSAAIMGGMLATSLGGRNSVFLFPPILEFISFEGVTNIVRPETLVNQTETITEVFGKAAFARSLYPARFRNEGGAVSTLSPPNPTNHYYVLVHAPGGGGETIELGVEALNRSGHPLKNKGRSFPPVRALSAQALAAIDQNPKEGCDAPIRPLTAYRLSSDKNNPNYNLYLSKPFAMTYERMSIEEVNQLKQELDREILWSGFYLRASLDLSMQPNPVLGQFATDADYGNNVLLTGVSAVVETFPAAYIMGPNPPAPVGHVEVPATFGTVSAHNGEFRSEALDMVLPGRRLPIEFVRTATGQDLYEGPFGRSWDFAYNQQLIELRPSVFPLGSRMPLVIRSEQNSDIAGTRDVVLQNGDGRNIIFKYAGTSVPPEYAGDPLPSELGWFQKAQAYYLPQRGAFDLLVRFKDGKFARLTPDGTQFWYSDRGRLQMIYDRHPKNRIRLDYNTRGELVRITDESVTVDRFIDIGYWRFQNESGFQAGLDEQTTNPFIAGKICRLKDYTGRDELFFYNEDGLLERREGPEITTANPGGFTGRPVTRYLWDTGCGDIKGIVAGSSDGTPLINASLDNSGGSPVVNQATGAAGPVTLELQYPNTALALESGTAKIKATAPDGAITEYLLNKLGLPTEAKLSGYGATNVTRRYEYTEDGLVARVTEPEGNSEETIYDSANPNLRSRSNILFTRRHPGPRGGDELEARFNYDSRYNLMSGQQTDFNGKVSTYSLTGNGREIQKIEHGADGTDSFEYNEYGQLTAHTTYEGVQYHFDYDENTGFKKADRRGDFVSTYTYQGTPGKRGLPSLRSYSAGFPLAFDYDERDEVISVKRGPFQRKNSYDENGNLIRVAATVDEGQELVQTREYDQINFMRKLTVENAETLGVPTNLVAVFEPDAAKRVKRITFPGGEVRNYDYDHLGRLIKITFGDYTEEYSYDLNDNLLSIKRGDAVKEYVRDGHDRIVKVIIPAAAGAKDEILLTYFGNGELKTLEVQDPNYGILQDIAVEELDTLGRNKSLKAYSDSVEPAVVAFDYSPAAGTQIRRNARGENTVLSYDQAGWVTLLSNSLATITYSYDQNGNTKHVSSQEGGSNYTNYFTYDEIDLLRSQQDGVGKVFDYLARFDGLIKEWIDGRAKTNRTEFTLLGEIKSERRPNQVEFHYTYNANRALATVKDKSNRGLTYRYDSTFRAEGMTNRNGGAHLKSTFDARNRPRIITLPGGGSISASYDLQGRLTSQTSSFQGITSSNTFVYDALDRVRKTQYGANTASYTYDRLGPLLEALVFEDGVSNKLGFQIYEDGSRKAITYPSGVTVAEIRPPNGRLSSVVPDSGVPLIDSISYEAANLAREIHFASNVFRQKNLYDARKRLLTRRYERVSDGGILAEVRYVYDAADNQVGRQFIHRNGRADFFAYDDGNRLIRADLGVRPTVQSAAPRSFEGFVTPPEVGAPFSPGFYARTYTYDAEGLDLFMHAETLNPDQLQSPSFATNRSGIDGFLFPHLIDGFDRGEPDPLGNTTHTVIHVRNAALSEPTPMAAAFIYNAKSELVRVERQDGISIEYRYQPTGLCFHRKVTDGTNILSETGFVYDNGFLIEEYDKTRGTNVLKARYFYADGDVPVAGDFRDAGGAINRFYFLTDVIGSVIAVANANGEVVERVSYDPWGQPTIELRDSASPRIARIVSSSGDLLVEFTEPVLPPLQNTAFTSNLVTAFIGLNDAITLQDGANISGTITLEENLTGFPFGTILRFHPSSPLTGQGLYTLTVKEGTLFDEWGNANPAESISVVFSPAEGAVLFAGPPSGSTLPSRVVRSSINSPFLFHGQYFDYDAGLIYMRARFYDPYTGHFLQIDPSGYRDSVNLYGAFAHNPVNFRDPSGEGSYMVVPRPKVKPSIDAVPGTAMPRSVLRAQKNIKVTHFKPSTISASRGSQSALGSTAADIAGAVSRRAVKEASKAVGGHVAKASIDALRGDLGEQFRKQTEAVLGQEFDEETRQKAALKRILGDVHDDFLDLLLTAEPIVAHLREFIRTSEITPEFSNDLGDRTLGVAERAIRDGVREVLIKLRAGSGEGQEQQVRGHEFFHAKVFMELGDSYEGLNLFKEEFFAELNGVRYEISVTGLNPDPVIGKSQARVLLETKGYRGLAESVIRRYQFDDVTQQQRFSVAQVYKEFIGLLR